MLSPPPDLRERSADVDAMQVVPDSKCGTDPWNPPRPVGVPIAFRAPTPLTTQIGLNTLASVDLNRDGRDDLVFANIPDNAVRVVYSNGNLFLPSAPSPVTLPATGTVPNGIATGNFNGDAFPDLAISYGGTSGAASVGVLLQGPVGQFSYFLPAGTGVLGSPAAIAATDLSGDGQDDQGLASQRLDHLFRLADLVLVPIKPTPDDLKAATTTVNRLKTLEVPFLFVITQAIQNTNITAQAIAALSHHGAVAETLIVNRVIYPAAFTDGRTPQEIEPHGPAAREIRKLWENIQSYFHTNIQSVAKNEREVAHA